MYTLLPLLYHSTECLRSEKIPSLGLMIQPRVLWCLGEGWETVRFVRSARVKLDGFAPRVGGVCEHAALSFCE